VRMGYNVENRSNGEDREAALMVQHTRSLFIYQSTIIFRPVVTRTSKYKIFSKYLKLRK